MSTTLPAVLYIVGFVLQVVGGLLVWADIRDDNREARRILGEGLPVTWNTVNAVGYAFIEHLRGRKVRRRSGVLLIFAGAAVELAANLTAL